MNEDRAQRMVVSKGRLGDNSRAESIRYWQSRSSDERIQAILDIRDFYYEVMHPGTGAPRLDRSIVGTRKLRH
ncbi:MAG TPA: hypothetical protein VG944_15145 [Fimbriimonas sp.]|nr:hypothetical protein [Fimbriimonas sp.]